jgi:hypothetical protein
MDMNTNYDRDEDGLFLPGRGRWILILEIRDVWEAQRGTVGGVA